jgi:hypothetical protein
MSTVDPRLTKTFVEWSDYMQPTLEVYGPIPRVFREGDWQEWGAGLLSLGGISAIGAPNPYQFNDWKLWATRLNEILNQGS